MSVLAVDIVPVEVWIGHKDSVCQITGLFKAIVNRGLVLYQPVEFEFNPKLIQTVSSDISMFSAETGFDRPKNIISVRR